MAAAAKSADILGTEASETVALDLFAGIAVSDYAAALEWYERLFGSAPSLIPSATEAVWELGEHSWVYIDERPEHAHDLR